MQTFPDWFRFAGQPTHRLKQIGNAVPPLLAEAMGGAVMAALRSRPGEDGARTVSTPSDRTCSPGTPSTRGAIPGGAAGMSPWEVLMAEMCLHRTRADQVGRSSRAAPSSRRRRGRWSGARRRPSRRCGRSGSAGGPRTWSRVAHALVDDFAGRVPDDELELRSLPGVGDYVAQAVLCFGFGRRAVLVDTNTSRITGAGERAGRRAALAAAARSLPPCGRRRARCRVQLRPARSRCADVSAGRTAMRGVPGAIALRSPAPARNPRPSCVWRSCESADWRPPDDSLGEASDGFAA